MKEVTALERVREEIRNGVLENASQAEQEIAIDLAKQLDAHKALLEAEQKTHSGGVNPNMQRRTIRAIGVSETAGVTLAGVTFRKFPVARFRAS